MRNSLPRRLREWFAIKSLHAVELLENEAPTNDQPNDYVLAYEAQFRAAHLDQATVEVWVTSAEYIGIGFEMRDRVAKRLGVRNLKDGFATGFEPSEKNEKNLFMFLDMVCEGKVAIRASVWPLVGLGKTEAVVLPEWMPEGHLNFGPSDWVRTVPTLQSHVSRRIVQFRPWT